MPAAFYHRLLPPHQGGRKHITGDGRRGLRDLSATRTGIEQAEQHGGPAICGREHQPDIKTSARAVPVLNKGGGLFESGSLERRDVRTVVAQGHGWNKPRRSNGAQPASLYAQQGTKSFQAICQCALMRLVVRTMVV